MKLASSVLLLASAVPSPLLVLAKYGEWAYCGNGASGLCIDTDRYTCSGNVLSGKCPGGASIKCCPSDEGYNRGNDACSAQGDGAVCKLTGDCDAPSTTVSGKCPDAPGDVKCCVPPSAPEGEWDDCGNGASGLCIDTTEFTCSEAVLSGKCPGPSKIKCCPSDGGYNKGNDACKAVDPDAVCKKASDCRGTSLQGKCPEAPGDVKCCVSNGGTDSGPGNPPSGNTFLPDVPDTSGSYGSCTTRFQKFSGECINRSRCTGATYNGRCPGPSSIMCCVAETTPTPVQSPPSMSLSEFRQLFTGISATRAEAFYPYFLTALEEGGIETCLEIANFVGQIGHESAGLRYFEEQASGNAYNWRADLGNNQRGDGPRFKGRGPIQLTGRFNYRAAGQDLGMDFEARPEQVCLPSAGFKAAVWYWTTNNLNRYATGTYNDYVQLTRRINGGTNGLSDRLNRWDDAKRVLQC